MSLMSLGAKIQFLQKGISEEKFSTKEKVKAAAMDLNISVAAGYENLNEEEKNLWYEQLVENLFVNHNNWIPCFIDIGFGREIIDHFSGCRSYSVPQKKHWKFIVKRDKYPQWQFNATVCTYSKEEALLIVKRFFEDFGGLGFYYNEPTPQTEHKVSWIEINTKKIGTYRDFVK